MIKKLKRKFLLTIMFFVTVIIVSFVTFITVLPARERNKEAKNFLDMLADNNGVRSSIMMQPSRDPSFDGSRVPPSEDKNNLFYMSNIATAHFDKNGVMLQWTSDRQDLYDETYLLNTAAKVLEKSDDFGITDGQYYLVKATKSGYLVILMDNSAAFDAQRNTFIFSCAAGIAIWIAFLLMAVFLVDKMTLPVSTAFQKQRQFISDAGHELKTPISVISANANVLEGEIGKNKWLDYINNESRRMEYLVKNLMALAAVDGSDENLNHFMFDFSKAVMSVCLPFESYAFEKGIVMDFDVAEEIYINGNEEKLKQVVSILLSNAVKYGNENGVIKVMLSKERKKTVLSVFNTGQGIANEDKDMIFERFYRADKARSRSGQSYGLGLAIAKAICDEHSAVIRAESEYGKWARFTVELPFK